MNLDPGCFAWMEDDDGPRPLSPVPRLLPDIAEDGCAAELAKRTGQGDGYCHDSAREFLILYRYMQSKSCGRTEASAALSERARVVSILRDMIAARCRRLEIMESEDIRAEGHAIATLQDAIDLIDPPAEIEEAT